MKNLKIKKRNFTLIYITFIILLWAISYITIIPNYKEIEIRKNHVNINAILSNINTDLENIKNIVNDYSKWDDTYEFINSKNTSYIYQNFREGTSTLEDLNIDLVLFTDKKNNIVFSKHRKNFPVLEKNIFIKEFINSIKNENNFFSIQRINDYLFYLIKLEVKKSDELGDSNGFMYAIKIVNDYYIKSITNIFYKSHINLISPNKKADNFLKNKYFEKVTLNKYFENNRIYNNLSFFSKDRFLFSIKTQNNSDILNEGLNIVFYYNFLISIIFLLFIYVIYMKQKDLEKYNDRLEDEVKKRTEKLDRSIRLIKEKNQELYRLSNIDSLTKIKNRRSFFAKSKELLKIANEKNKNLSVLLIDIDHFKKINDTYGHAIGDKVLQEFCSTIISIIKEDAVFGRIGGEEFCLTLYNKDNKFIYSMAEKIRKECEENIMKISELEIKFTISIGISSNKNKDEYIDEILQEADNLLYTAKKSGRNRVIRSGE